jgi:hypothetical protein
MDFLELGTKIGEGRYREAYRLGNRVYKVLKPTLTKHYGPFSKKFDIENYTRNKFGIDDFNQYEFDSYRSIIGRIPNAYHDMFAHVRAVYYVGDRSVSISDLVINSDGQVSKTLAQGLPQNKSGFLHRLDDLELLLYANSIPLLDIRAENIVVREQLGESTPVIVDFKKYGSRVFPFQPWLKLEVLLRHKMMRRFNRLKDEITSKLA